MKEKLKLFGRIMIFIGCIGIMLFGALFVMHKDQNKDDLLEISNPLTEVKNVSEMHDYLGYKVPLIEDKEVSKYIVIGKGKHAIHGRIIYKDKSEFDIEQGELDVSGIYGSKLLKEESISGIPIKIYIYEDTIYGIWTYEDYSYSYSMLGSDPDNLNIEINKIISLIR